MVPHLTCKMRLKLFKNPTCFPINFNYYSIFKNFHLISSINFFASAMSSSQHSTSFGHIAITDLSRVQIFCSYMAGHRESVSCTRGSTGKGIKHTLTPSGSAVYTFPCDIDIVSFMYSFSILHITIYG